MKQLFTAIALFCALSIFAQSDTATASFDKLSYSFGKILQGKPVTTAFVFTNTGDKPLIIESAVAGCGCTTPDYPKSPVLKGKTGTIKVTYNAAAEGQFTKQVTVKFANYATPAIVTITGEVEKTSTTPQ